MKDQINTIHEALEAMSDGKYSETMKVALAALAELARTHFTSEDVADASAQVFRDGVASVTAGQEPVVWQILNGVCHAGIRSSESLAKEAAAGMQKNHDLGGSLAAFHVRPLYTAAPVAQQPQARPDFTDEWTGYLKDGETPFERFLRERKDVQSVLKLYQRALEENERLKAQQPQAEAVGCDYCSNPLYAGIKCPSCGRDSQQPQADEATSVGLEASISILSQLVDEQRQLLAEVDAVFGMDAHGIVFEDGDSALIDRVRAHLAATNEARQPQAEPFGYVSQHTDGMWYFSKTMSGVYLDTAKSVTTVFAEQPQSQPTTPSDRLNGIMDNAKRAQAYDLSRLDCNTDARLTGGGLLKRKQPQAEVVPDGLVSRPDEKADYGHDNSTPVLQTPYYCAVCDEHMGDVRSPDDVPLRKWAVCYSCQKRATPAPQQAEAVPSDVMRDAERYRQVRRGQKWSVINGIGDELKGEALDAAIDAALAAAPKGQP